MVYVDSLRVYGNGKGYWKARKSCHLIADSLEELMAFAKLIGLRKEWFQPKSSPHFDLTERRRKFAVSKGAIELTRKEFVTKIRELREKIEKGE